MKQQKPKKPDMKELSRRAHAAKKAKKLAMASLRAWPLTDATGERRAISSPEDAQAVASWTAEMVALGHLSAADGKSLTAAVSAWGRAHNEGRLAKRLGELEEIVALVEERGSWKQQARIRELERRLNLKPGQALEPPDDKVVDAEREAALDRIAGRKP